MSELIWIIEEKIGGDGWWVMEEEGLCNPYTNPVSAWDDFKYIVEHSKYPEDYRLVIEKKDDKDE